MLNDYIRFHLFLWIVVLTVFRHSHECDENHESLKLDINNKPFCGEISSPENISDDDPLSCITTSISSSNVDYTNRSLMIDLETTHFIKNVSLTVSNMIYVNTSNESNYTYSGIDFSGSTFMLFGVKACNTAQVILTESSNVGQVNFTRFRSLVIDNEGYSLRNCSLPSCQVAMSKHGDSIGCSNFKYHWISWAGGVIKHGRQKNLFQSEKCSWIDPHPMNGTIQVFVSTAPDEGLWELTNSERAQYAVGFLESDPCSVMAGAADPVFSQCGMNDNAIVSGTPADINCGQCGRYLMISPANFTKHIQLCHIEVYGYEAKDISCSKEADLHIFHKTPASTNEIVTFMIFVQPSLDSFNLSLAFGVNASSWTNLNEDNIGDFPAWADVADIGVDIEKYSQILLMNHTYTNPGKYEVVLRPIIFSWNRVEILGGGAERNLSISYRRGQSILLEGSVSHSCNITYEISWHGTVHMMGIYEKSPSDENELQLEQEISLSASQLVISPFMLNYGTYAIKLNITLPIDMYGQEASIDASTVCWINISPEPLHASIAGGATRAIGLNSTITMDGTNSRDPDLPLEPDDQDLTLIWFCTRSGEELPLNPLGVLFNASGGCFDEGMKLYEGTNSFEFQGRDLHFTDIPSYFTFHLFVTKPERSQAYTTQGISLVAGDPPLIQIQCFINCGQSMNPSQKLSLKSFCENCAPGEHHADPTVPTLEWDTQTTTGQEESNLVIKAGVFDEVVTEETYMINVTVTRLDTSQSSASYLFTTNIPPTEGICTIQPNIGTVLQTNFNISCSGFSDPNGPLTYEVRRKLCNSNGDSELLQFSSIPIFSPMMLSVGERENNFSVCLTVVCRDSYGAATSTAITVTVNDLEISLDDIANMTHSEGSAFSDIINSGNKQALNQFVSTVSSILNLQSDTEDGPQQTAQRKSIRESFVSSIASVKVSSLETLQQTSASLSEITKIPTELSSSAQSTAATSLLAMSDFLKNQTLDKTEIVQDASRLLLSGVANIMNSVNSNATSGDDINYDSAENSKNVTLATLGALKGIKSAISSSIVSGEDSVVMETDSVTIQLRKMSASSLNGSNIIIMSESASSQPAVSLPDTFNISTYSLASEIGTEIVQFRDNPFLWSDTSSGVNSKVVEFIFKNEDTDISVADLEEPIDIYIPSKDSSFIWSNLSISDSKIGLLGFNISNENSTFVTVLYMSDYLADPDTVSLNDELVGINILLNMNNLTIENGSYVNALNETLANGTVVEYLPDMNGFIIHSVNYSISDLLLTSEDNSTTLIIPGEDIPSDGEYILQIRTLSPGLNLTLFMGTVQSECLFWNSTEEIWSDTGCIVGPYTTGTRLHCSCTHLTSFGGGLFVMPNKLNFKEDLAKFLTFWENPIGIIVVSIVLGLYAFLWQWAVRNDVLDHKKAMPIEMVDNNPRDSHAYVIVLYTGSRRGAGTTSEAFITITGTKGKTVPHRLSCVEFPVLQRGDINTFLLRNPKSIGEITSIKVWIHSMGDDVSWFLSRASITDLETEKNYHFVCKSWLALDIGDCTFVKEFPVADEKDIEDFEYVWFTNAATGFNDKHLWFSIINRPAQSNFTRVQRLSCCLSLIMSYMLCNIMFYGIDNEPGEQKMDMGPFTITWTQLRIGLQTSVLMFPINFLIVWLFQHIRERIPVHNPWSQHPDLNLPKEIPLTQRSGSTIAVDMKASTASADQHKIVSIASNAPGLFRLVVDDAALKEQMKEKDTLKQLFEVKKSTGLLEKFGLRARHKRLERELAKATETEQSIENSLKPSEQSLPNHKSRRTVYTPECKPEEILSLDKVPSSASLPSFRSASSSIRPDVMLSTVDVQDIDVQETEKAETPFHSATSVGKAPTREPEPLADEAAPLKTPPGRRSSSRRKSDLQQQPDAETPTPRYNLRRRNKWQSAATKLQAVTAVKVEEIKPEVSTADAEESGKESRNQEENLDMTTADAPVTQTRQMLNISGTGVQEIVETVEHREPQSDEKIVKIQSPVDSSSDKSIALEQSVRIDGFSTDETLPGIGQKPGRCLMPWWCIFLPWSLVISLTATCSFFTILYTFNFGLEKSLGWLKSLIFSFVFDVFIEQPLKVIGVSLFVAVILKKPANIDLPDNEAFVREIEDDTEDLITILRLDPRYRPPKKSATHSARDFQETERRMFAILVEIIRYLLFLYLVMLVAYLKGDNNMYYMNNMYKQMFLEQAHEVTSLDDFWKWMNQDVLDSMYGDENTTLGFIAEETSYKIGQPYLRLKRTLFEQCNFTGMLPHVRCEERESDEDMGCYHSNWTNMDGDCPQSTPWAYTRFSMPGAGGIMEDYGSGGYIAQLGTTREDAETTIAHLFDNNWIDRKTTAVYLESAFYNANVNLFSLMSVLFELPKYGGVLVSTSVQSMKLYRSTQGLHIFVLILECCYAFYAIYFLIYEFRRYLQMKSNYFKSVWNLLELGNVMVSMTLIAVYIAHSVEVNYAIEKYRNENTIDFNTVCVLDEILNILFGLLVSYGMLKFIHLLRFNPMIHHFQSVIHRASPGLLIMTLAFSVCFAGFGSMMALLTGWRVAIMKNIPNSFKSLFLAVLGDSNIVPLSELHPFWGPALMIAFIFTFLFIGMNLLVTLLISSLAEVKAAPQPADDAELLWLLFEKYKQWLGIKNQGGFQQTTWETSSEESVL